jgi:hypothetical protein
VQKLKAPFGPNKTITMSFPSDRFREMILGMRDGKRLCLVVSLYNWVKMLVARGETNETGCLNAFKKLRKDIMAMRGGSLIHSQVWDLFEYVPENSHVFCDLDKVGFDVGKLDPCWTRHYVYNVGASYSEHENQMMQEDDYGAFLEEQEQRQARIESSSIVEDPISTPI